MNNHEVAEKLRLLGLLCQFAGETRFKTAAYEKVTEALEESQTQITLNNVYCFNGVGVGIGQKLESILATGSCAKLDKLLPEYEHLFPLLEVSGIGPAKAKLFYDQFGATSVADIRQLVEEGRIVDKRIVEGVQASNARMPLNAAKIIAKVFIDGVKQKVHDLIKKIDVTGSLRREKDMVGDLDIIILTNSRTAVTQLIRAEMDTVLSSGDEKISGLVRNKRCQVRFAREGAYGAMLLHFTGSKEHNIKLRQRANSMGMLLNEYGLWQNEKLIAAEYEQDIFSALGLPFVPPQHR